MDSGRTFRAFAVGLAVVSSTSWSLSTFAQPAAAPPTSLEHEERTRLAGERFAVGNAAFVRGDYRLAGDAFDAAFLLEPHYDALWNSAQAWESAGELARAANRYGSYLTVTPASAPGRAQATQALARLSQKLGRIHIVTVPNDVASVDGETMSADVVYVYPGNHAVTIRRDGGSITRDVSVAAREDRSVSFGSSTATTAPSATTAETRPAPLPPPGGPPPGTRFLAPWVFVGSAALTVGSGVLAGYFGSRAVSLKGDFDRNPSAELLRDGRRQQSLANVGLGTTIGLAVATTCIALFFVDWGGSRKTAAIAREIGSLRVRFP